MKRTRLSKLISFTICFLMVFSLMPVSALADGDSGDTTQVELTPPTENGSGTEGNQPGVIPPDESGELPPEQQGELPPEQQSELPPEQQSELPPEQQSELPPEQQSELLPEETAELPAPGPFTVQFSVDGNIDDNLTQTIDAGGLVSRPDNPDVPNGKDYKDMSFLYWTAKDNAPYDFSAEVASSFVLYAKFGVQEADEEKGEEVLETESLGMMAMAALASPYYPITYILDGGENNPANPRRYTHFSSDFILSAPTKFGYTFDYWSPNNGVIAANTTGALEFTAHWKDPIAYSIDIKVLGGPPARRT